MHHATTRTLALAALLAPLAACGGSDDPVDLGHDDPRSLGSALSDYAGAWEGRAEAYEFDDGSDRLQLEIRSDGTGDLLLGDSRLPAPDPNHGFPPSLPSTTPLAAGPDPVAGFPYPISGARVSDGRIQISSAGGEVYREWCELMTPQLATDATPPHYACLGATAWATVELGKCSVGDVVVDCTLATCLYACECTQEACTVKAELDEPNIQIDARLEDEGDSVVGTLVLGSERIPVLMARM